MTFFTLLFAYLFSQFFRSFLTIIAADLTRDLGFGPSELGWIGFAWFGTFALAQFLVGYLLDTLGPRRTMGGLMCVGVAGAIIFALSNGFHMSFLGMALIGIGCSPMLMSALYIFGRTERPERFATLASLMVGFGNIGNLIAASPLAYAAQAFGWRWSTAFVGIAMGAAAAANWMLIKDPPRVERTDGSSASVLGDLVTLVKMRPLWLVFPLHLFSYAVIATERGLWVGPFLEKVHGLDALARGDIILAMSIAMALGALACGPAARVFRGQKTPAIIGNVLTLCFLLLLALMTQAGVIMAAAFFVGIGFFGLTYSLLLGHGRQFVPDHLLGRGVTLLNFLAIGGAGIMQAVTGAYMDRLLISGQSHVQAFQQVHLLMFVLLGLVLALFVFAPAKPKP